MKTHVLSSTPLYVLYVNFVTVSDSLGIYRGEQVYRKGSGSIFLPNKESFPFCFPVNYLLTTRINLYSYPHSSTFVSFGHFQTYDNSTTLDERKRGAPRKPHDRRSIQDL